MIPSLSEVYARWHNASHGFELQPDINTGEPNNENGILFHATFLNLLYHKNIRDITTGMFFFQDLQNTEVEQGLYHRCAYSFKKSYKERNANSKDNYLGILSGCYVSHFYGQMYEVCAYGKRNFFIYNNVKPRWMLPFNPGDMFLVSAFGGYKKLAAFLFPFYVINTIISCNTNKQETSGKILRFITLPHLVNKYKYLKPLYNYYIRKMKKQYGDFFVEELMKIYYTNPQHPNRLYAQGIKLDEVV